MALPGHQRTVVGKIIAASFSGSGVRRYQGIGSERLGRLDRTQMVAIERGTACAGCFGLDDRIGNSNDGDGGDVLVERCNRAINQCAVHEGACRVMNQDFSVRVGVYGSEGVADRSLSACSTCDDVHALACQ